MPSFSQTSYPHILNDSLVVITAEQLKTANLVFLERSSLEATNNELKSQLDDYKFLYEEEVKLDSLYTKVIIERERTIDASKEQIKQQQQTIDITTKKLKWWRISGCGVVLILIGACLL